MRSKSLSLAVAVSLSALTSCQKGPISIDTVNRLLIDQHKRSVLLHGVNIVYKVDPYVPSTDAFDPYLSMTD